MTPATSDGAPATVGQALRRAHRLIESGRIGSDSPELDAQLLLADLRACSRARLMADLREPLDAGTWSRLERRCLRRAGGESVAYILGRAAFHTIELEVGPAVLVPRPETELLVEAALDWLEGRRERTDLRAIDVGTGSGAIILALAAALRQRGWLDETSMRPGIELLAVDISAEALAIAERNARRLDLAGRIRFEREDLLPEPAGRYDLILANLPYIGLEDRHRVEPGVDRHEPHLALYAGPDGLTLLRRMIDRLPEVLRPGGLALLEMGDRQGPALLDMARKRLPEARIELRADLAGLDRMLRIERRP